MVFVSVSETYDLKTVKDKMSVICVHTPDNATLKHAYPGFHLNYRFFRLNSCDVSLACASMLPADPLQVGEAAGDIAPEDLFNPILYKAMSSEGMSNLEKRLMAMVNGDSGVDDISDGSVKGSRDFFVVNGNDFDRYYTLLSNPAGWKMANPQSGLRMDNLYPLVYETWTNLGGTNEYPNVNPSGEETTTPAYMTVKSFRGSAHKMPRMPCTVYTGNSPISVGFPGLVAGNVQKDLPDYPVCPVACIIVPPSRLHSLYFRMVIKWTIEYTEPRPFSDIADFSGLSYMAANFYGSDYSETSKNLGMEHGNMVDAAGMEEIKKVMSTGL